MSQPRAVLVDDDPQQLLEATEALQEAGFAVTTFPDAQGAFAFLDGEREFVDLFVLDRKLPMKAGESKVDELGDALFDRVIEKYRDARILVFSGYTDFDHAQALMEQAGLVFEQGVERIDRVSVLKKTQFDKFERHLSDLQSVLQRLEQIDVVVDIALESIDKRALRRVAYHYGATSVRAIKLSGGLTGAKVWQCRVKRAGGSVATVVVKQGKPGKAAPAAGGLQDLLPRNAIARRIEAIAGLTGGSAISVLQIAGTDPVALMDLLPAEDEHASELIRILAAELDALDRSYAALRLSQLVEPLIDWSSLETQLTLYGVAVPSPDLWVTTSLIMSHTDLHAANILICDGEPVIIDADDSCFASALLEPVTLLISSFVHPHSLLTPGEWPSTALLETDLGKQSFGSDSACPEWYAAVCNWVTSRMASPREFWAICLALAARQTTFRDVYESERTLDRVLAIANRASKALLAG